MRGKLWLLALVLALLPGCGERVGLESAPCGGGNFRPCGDGLSLWGIARDRGGYLELLPS